MSRESGESASGRRPIHRGKVVDLGLESAELPNGDVWELEVIRHPGAAAILPLQDDGQVVLIRQWRHAAGGWLLEVPAGKRDQGEAPEICAHRELEEEVGLRAGRLEDLGWIFTTPGFADEQIWLYLATELEPGVQQLEEDELLSIVRMPLEEACQRAVDGEIRDAKTVCTLLRARQKVARDASADPS